MPLPTFLIVQIIALCGFLGVVLLPSVRDAQAQSIDCGGVHMCPNLKAYPAFDLSVKPDVNDAEKQNLRFSTLSWNSGRGPLELIAGDVNSQSNQTVYQRIFRSDGAPPDDNKAGDFDWHDGHSHFHFDNYAEYVLASADFPLVSQKTGTKTTFCVMDTSRINTRLPGASKKAVYKWCGDEKQGMSVGWGDQYSSHLIGQEIDITGLIPGDYRLTIKVDPKNLIKETNDNDNESCTLINIDAVAESVSVIGDGSCEAPTTDGAIVLTDARPYKFKGKVKVDLRWENASTNVDIYRNPPPTEYSLPVNHQGSSYEDSTGVKGHGSFTYWVCPTGNSEGCSNEVTANY